MLRDAVHNLHPAHGGMPSENHTLELWDRVAFPAASPAIYQPHGRNRKHGHNGKSGIQRGHSGHNGTHAMHATQAHGSQQHVTGLTCEQAALHAQSMRPNASKLELGRTVYRLARKQAEWEEYQAAVKASLPVARSHLAQLEAAEAKAREAHSKNSKMEAAKASEVLAAEATARAAEAKAAEAKATEAAGKQVKAAEHAAEAAAQAAHGASLRAGRM